MTANELADYLDNNVEAMLMSEQPYLDQAATMLRQQQAEIAELKHMNKNWQISENILLLELEKLQQRELTDEEIADMVCSGEYWELSEGKVIIAVHFDKFAKAILRKAQEK